MKSCLLLLLSAFSLIAEDLTLKLDGIEDEIVVSLPENHNSEQNWPAILYYHGTNGRPQTQLMRSQTGNEDWIVVGMAYAQRGPFQLTPEGMNAEIAVLKKVVAELKKKVNLDPTRVYASGFSKGGWMSGLLLQKERSLAGAVILGGGHLDRLPSAPKTLPTDTPVFIGVGREDRNYPASIRALVFFRKLGAKIDFESWDGLGHSFPRAGSASLKEWLILRSGKQQDRKELDTELAKMTALPDKVTRWWSLLKFSERPFVSLEPELQAEVKATLAKLEEDPAIAREARILKESRRLLGKETSKISLETLEEVVAGYERIVKFAQDSPQRSAASSDYERASEVLGYARKEYEAQLERAQEIEVKPETGRGFGNGTRRGFLRNPLVR